MLNFNAKVVMIALMLSTFGVGPLFAAKPPKYITIKSCSVSSPPCYVTLRTAVASGDTAVQEVEAPTADAQRIRQGCYDGVGVYLAPCTSKKHLQVQIID